MKEKPALQGGYELLFGPGHPGSGNFSVRLGLDGERIASARADPGYLHRGFEKMMEYRRPMENAVLSDRICVLEPLAWNLVHAEAVDKLTCADVPERASYIRVAMAELSRIQSHLIWYGSMSAAIGFDTGFKLAFGYRDYILDIFEAVTGGRLYPAGYICPGGVRRDLPDRIGREILGVLEKAERMRLLERMENPSLLSRMKGIGLLKRDDAIRLGATGPVLRSSGVESDVRKEDPYEIYDRLDFDVPTLGDGDAHSRYLLGIREIEESIGIVRQALKGMPGGELKPVKPVSKIPEGEAYVRNEVARGEGCIHMVSDGSGRPYRCKIRGPSLLHMLPVLEHLLRGHQIADVPAIYWSLNPCPADADR
jgi:NADH-quinone oxidoreductase subunit D